MNTTQTTTPALRVRAAFEAARNEKRGVLIPYFMCGYPSAQQSAEVVLAAAEAGADLIELGLPFSDPLADGATIQHAGHLALERGMTMRGCLEIARQVSARSSVPLILMGYYNPLLSYGLERFCQDAAAHGACGLIIPDLPPDEADSLQEAAIAAGLTLIFLIPPTTPDERIAQIARRAASIPGSFIYCVSLSGVTGASSKFEILPSLLARIHGYTKEMGLPVVVGFGLTNPDHIAFITGLTDGSVVGTALIKLLDQHAEHEQIAAIRTYIRSLYEATSWA
ncbi:MAG TPA: tryptophan synthase subunit alpha [Ktedonobacteraceae bacterium]|nr:tryptophan synthase subunit alpha [Ktedonobacteraceae bacterium]